ncbi:hypothetical protein HD806DRAFT_515296 [Xylariaceae sp. AK1471]|nr:hypothetical protein HD806DRAFT_515296 [Xylariaceae sp. AK1471]
MYIESAVELTFWTIALISPPSGLCHPYLIYEELTRRAAAVGCPRFGVETFFVTFFVIFFSLVLVTLGLVTLGLLSFVFAIFADLDSVSMFSVRAVVVLFAVDISTSNIRNDYCLSLGL